MISNRFDEKYDIRMAYYEEIDELMQFIDNNWKKGHILATNRDFFEYEHVADGKVNFLIAKNRENNEIEGILGFLPASKDEERLDIWGVVWKVKENAMPMLGIELKKRIPLYAKARSEMGVGCNVNTSVPLLKRLMKYQVDKMKHYYILSDCTEFKIAKVSQFRKKCVEEDKSLDIVIKLCSSVDDLSGDYIWKVCRDMLPCKDKWYINKRYFLHPIYKYDVYSISDQNIIKAAIIIREEKCNGNRALRIVDYIGESVLFSGLYDFFKRKLKEVEYIDMYCLGMEEEYILKAGMVERTEEDPNIIPNYFHPFEQTNVDIWVASSQNNAVFFKADGDQDRPN